MDELKNLKADYSVIPEGCLSFVEESSYIMSAIDEDFELVLEKCGAGSEVDNAVETDAEEVEEAALTEAEEEEAKEKKLAAIKDKVVGAIKKAWEKMKTAFEKAIAWIKEQAATAKAKVKGATYEKMVKKFGEMAAKKELPSDSAIGLVHDFKKLTDTKWIDIISKAAGAEGSTEGLPLQVAKAVNGAASGNVTVEMMKKFMKEGFMGPSKNVFYQDINANGLKKYVDNILGEDTKDVKVAYNAARKQIQELLKLVKSTKKGTKGEEREAIKNEIENVKRCLQVLAAGNAVFLDCVRTRKREAWKVITKVFALTHKFEKKTKEEAKNEAVDIFAW